MRQRQLYTRSNGLPPELSALLQAPDDSQREAAWERFVGAYSRLLLHTAHSQARGYDAAMNRYAFVMQKLREDDFRRLEQFTAEGEARFSTWLVVVARRLCVDYMRSRYGRDRSDPGVPGGRNGVEPLAVRRRLFDMLAEELELDGLGDPSARNPEVDVRTAELQTALATAVQALPARDRLLLKLRFHDEMKAREIADLMEFPSLFHVYRHLTKVLGALRARLERRGIQDPTP